mmetsp:Transcript_23128/g.71070  ORF Transcript_23128/g.71070 Transcript_23128/m.71070 type:complete len:236 (-) Transcript_23128:30-737(-)
MQRGPACLVPRVLGALDAQPDALLVLAPQSVEVRDVRDAVDDLRAFASPPKASEDARQMVPMRPARMARLDGRGYLADAEVRLEDVCVALGVAAFRSAVDGVVGDEFVGADLAREEAADVAVVPRGGPEAELRAHGDLVGHLELARGELRHQLLVVRLWLVVLGIGIRRSLRLIPGRIAIRGRRLRRVWKRVFVGIPGTGALRHGARHGRRRDDCHRAPRRRSTLPHGLAGLAGH